MLTLCFASDVALGHLPFENLVVFDCRFLAYKINLSVLAMVPRFPGFQFLLLKNKR